ncbi:DUF6020 family protein [Furfurilactobacillus rossiae]|nr:DUF6020 family protein [Furfurilactobacillus rossiae]
MMWQLIKLGIGLFTAIGVLVSLVPLNVVITNNLNSPAGRFAYTFLQHSMQTSLQSMITSVAIICFMYWSLDKRPASQLRLYGGILSFIIGFFTTMGFFFSSFNNLPLAEAHSTIILVIGFLKAISISSLLFQLFKIPYFVKWHFQTISATELQLTKPRIFIGVTLFIILCWSAYLFVLYPGTMSWDTLNQLAEFFGKHVTNIYPTGHYLLHAGQSTISDHHPYVSTLIYGSVVKLAVYCGSAKLGLFTLSLLQTIFSASVLTYSILILQKLQFRTRWLVASILFYALFPLFPLYSIFVVKNTVYSISVLWFSLLIIHAMLNKSLWSTPWWIISIILSLSIQIFNIKYGFYVALVASISVLFTFKTQGKRIFAIFFVPILLFQSSYMIGRTILHIIPGDPVEMYSIPFQQTARYLRTYPNDVTVQERKTLNRMFDVSNMKKLYNPNTSDPLKSGGGGVPTVYRYKSANAQDLKEYRKVWLHMFLKHPGIYFAAFFNQTYQYLSLDSRPSLTVKDLATDDFPLNLPMHSPKQYEFTTNGKRFTFNYTTRKQHGRNIIIIFCNLLLSLPIISILFRGTTFFIASLILLMYVLAEHRYRWIAALSVIWMQIPFCLLSPVNGSQRYMYPFLFSGLLIIASLITIFSKRHHASSIV